MTSLRPRQPTATGGFLAEAGRLRQLVGQLLSILIDRAFDLSAARARHRRQQALLLGLSVFVISFVLYELLGETIGGFAATSTGSGGQTPRAILMAARILVVMGIACFIAWQSAGQFIQDVFELKDARVAWRFVIRLVTGEPAEVLQIRKGRVADKDRNSPVIQIGGPARVVLDLESAAMFEKPDGSPRVVGAVDLPAKGTKQTMAEAVLDGFERLREPVVDLRDQYLGNPSGRPLTLVGRSLDGLPISVADVRGVFSVRRVNEGPDRPEVTSRPFPVRSRDIENLVYRQSVDVLTDGSHASGTPGEWTSSMRALISEALQEFMAQNRLSEFLSGVGKHELERSEYRSDTILSRTLQVSAEAPGSMADGTGRAPRFRPRTDLSASFRNPGSDFSRRTQEMGMELHWIGVGTWVIPDASSQEAVNAKHVEAWRIDRENTSRLEGESLDRISRAALLEQKLRLIEEVPLLRHARNQLRYSDKSVLMECLLQDFWEQLSAALDVYYRVGVPSAAVDELEGAVARLEQLLGIPPGGKDTGTGTRSSLRRRESWDKTLEGPPAPSTRAEALQYQALLSKLKGDHRVAEAVLANEKRRHAELSRQQLIARVVARFERHGR